MSDSHAPVLDRSQATGSCLGSLRLTLNCNLIFLTLFTLDTFKGEIFLLLTADFPPAGNICSVFNGINKKFPSDLSLVAEKALTLKASGVPGASLKRTLNRTAAFGTSVSSHIFRLEVQHRSFVLTKLINWVKS